MKYGNFKLTLFKVRKDGGGIGEMEVVSEVFPYPKL
jgi:hypothetical protein